MQNQSQVVKYRTRKDRRMVFLIVLVLTLPLILGFILVFAKPQNLNNSFVGGVILILVGVICWIIFFIRIYPSYYEITSSSLIIRSGLYRRIIPLASIQKIYPPTRVPHATWSFDQLRVDYRVPKQSFLRTLFIAPEDKVAFLQDVAEREDALEIVDGTLVHRH